VPDLGRYDALLLAAGGESWARARTRLRWARGWRRCCRSVRVSRHRERAFRGIVSGRFAASWAPVSRPWADGRHL